MKAVLDYYHLISTHYYTFPDLVEMCKAEIYPHSEDDDYYDLNLHVVAFSWRKYQELIDRLWLAALGILGYFVFWCLR